MKLSKSTTFVSTLIIAALLVSIPAIAQDEPPGPMVEYWNVHIDHDAGPAFEEAVKSHMALRKEKGDPNHWETFTPNTGSDLYIYHFRSCCFAWADFDAHQKWEIDNADIQQDWNQNVHPHVASYEHGFEEIDFANSNWPEDGATIRYVGVTEFKIKPGMGRQFNAAKEELSQIALNNGWGDDNHWSWGSPVGGKPAVWLASPYENYADMAPPEQSFFEFVSELLGSEEATAAKFASFSDATYGSKYQIWTHREDLSTPE